ncbi:MAG: hypothetical protein N2554_09380 [Fimbriimonadales bacterium]|nr:hypothetical protein [Fimbriimonadales bacterium]
MAQVESLRMVLRTRVGEDGVLEIHAPTPLSAGEVEVELCVRPLRKLPRGTPGYKLAELAGSLSDEAAEEMLTAIEEGCEQVDPSQW